MQKYYGRNSRMENRKTSIVFFVFTLLIIHFAFCNAEGEPQLSNGLTLIAEEREEPPLVYLYLTVKAGSIYEGEYLGTGISHFVEHMVFKGREQDELGAFAQKISSMGGELNAYTSFDKTCYYILIPSSHWKEALDILLNAVFNPSFESKEMEKEREVILREMALKKDNPSRFLSTKLWEKLFTVHPYKYPVLGEKHLFLELKREDLVNYHKKMYVPNNMILVVCGDIDKEKIRNYLEQEKSNIKPAPISPIVLPKEPSQFYKKEFIVEKEVNMDYMDMGFHIPAFGHEDMYALDILSVILGDGKSSRLYKRLREEESLVHSVSSFSFTPFYEGVFNISTVMEQGNTEMVKIIIFEEIQNIKNRDIKREEMEKAKNILKMQELSIQETLEGRAAELAVNYLYTQDLNFTSKYLEKIEKVREEDVVQVARKYLTDENCTIVVLKNPEEIKEDKIKPETASEKPSKEVFVNELTLISRKNSALPLVSVTAIMGGGLIIEKPENNGICKLFSSMLFKGTKNHTYTEIIKNIESRGGSITTFSGNNSLGVKANVKSEDIDVALETLADILLNCNFPEDELEKEKEAQIMQITREKDHIFNYGFKEIKKEFFGEHPYSLSSSGEIPAVSSISQEDLLQLKEKLITGKNMVISVSGDFDKNELKEKIDNLFATLPRGEKVEGGYSQHYQKGKANLEGQWKQSVLMISFPAPPRKSEDFYIMEVLNTYLNGMTSPLFSELRDKKALAYTIGTISLSGWDPGIFIFYIATVKEKLQEALTGMQEEIVKIKNGDLEESDIESAKKKLLTQKWKNLQDNSSFSLEFSLSELYGLGYEEPLKLKETISYITKDDIIRFANEYFKEEQSTVLLLEGN